MKSTDYAYTAGYLDGDGCFGISNTFTYSLSITSINIENVNWFKERYEGSLSSRQPKDNTRQVAYSFRFNIKGLSHLPEIEKYLVEKKEECEIFKRFADVFLRRNKDEIYQEMKNVKYNKNLIVKSMKAEVDSIEKSIEPTIEDFAYLAGFVDAECSLDILKRMQPKGGQYSYVAQIQCNNTKFPFFKWAAQRFGGSFYFVNNSKYSNRRNQMIWRLRGKECYPVLEQILPFLNYKKNICNEIIKLRKTEFLRKDCPSPNHPRFMEYFEPIRLEKESIYQSVRQFNNPY
jgi:hypothetical protein